MLPYRKQIHKLRGHSDINWTAKIIDRDTAISASRDTTIRLWDIKRGVCKRILAGHEGSVLCFDTYGDILVSGSEDSNARVFCMSGPGDNGLCLHILKGHEDQVSSVVFRGKRVVTTSLDRSVRIWDVDIW